MSYNQKFHDHVLKLDDEKISIPAIDAHIHFLDFLQKGEGVVKMMEAMEKANVQKSIVFGMSVRKKWEFTEKFEPLYYLDDNGKCYYFSHTDEFLADEFLKLSEKQHKKFAPHLCGFNPTDKFAIDYVKYMYKKYPFWKGIGEVFFRHDDLTNLTNEETARANHPAMFPIYNFAAERDLPVIIHQNSTSVGHHANFEYLAEITEVLEKFPKTKIIWSHCGISRRIEHKEYTEMLAGILGKYPNIYLDISWVVFDDIICEKLVPKKEWIDFFENFSDRIFLGSDLTGHFGDLKKVIGRYNILLSMLSKETANKIAFDNADKMWFSEK